MALKFALTFANYEKVESKHNNQCANSGSWTFKIKFTLLTLQVYHNGKFGSMEYHPSMNLENLELDNILPSCLSATEDELVAIRTKELKQVLLKREALWTSIGDYLKSSSESADAGRNPNITALQELLELHTMLAYKEDHSRKLQIGLLSTKKMYLSKKLKLEATSQQIDEIKSNDKAGKFRQNYIK